MPQVLRDLRFHSFSFICDMNYKGLTRRSFILGLSALGLTGCGWHLRGKQNVPFKTIYIALGENSAVRATIRRNLEAQTEVKVVNDRKEAEAIFELLGQSRGSNVLAYNTDGRARIYSLRLTNTFRVVLQNGVELLPTTTVSATRELIRDESDENGRANQERLLYEEMEQSCIHQMVSRMTHISEEAVQKGMHELE